MKFDRIPIILIKPSISIEHKKISKSGDISITFKILWLRWIRAKETK